MYTVIGSPRTRTGRVIWFLEELGEPYELEPVAPHSDLVNKYNESGRVPVLLDGDDAIIDSVAICTYLADKHRKFTARPGTLERARQDAMILSAIDDLDCHLFSIMGQTVFLPEGKRIPAIVPLLRDLLSRGLDTLSHRLGSHPYAAGESFSIADIIVGHCLFWAKSMEIPLPQGSIPTYCNRLANRPAFGRLTKISADVAASSEMS